jgi:diguanylate cyclase (GGDEF)-like protein
MTGRTRTWKERASAPQGTQAPPLARRADTLRTVEVPQAGGPTLSQLAAEVARLEADLAAARAKVAELEARADVDPLTDIFNRRGFERELTRSLAYVARYRVPAALIYLDLDRFKPVNDRHGHAAGDAVLQAVAAALVRGVRASDVVARVGGDEFAVILWNLSEAEAAAKAQALMDRIAALTIGHGGVNLRVGASAGTTALAAGDTVQQALARADRAMYARKREKAAAGGGSA